MPAGKGSARTPLGPIFRSQILHLNTAYFPHRYINTFHEGKLETDTLENNMAICLIA
jgi:hypothetical protein